MTTVADAVKATREHMDKAVESVKREFSTIRSGKASTSLLDLVRVEAYGQVMPLNQVALVGAPEARLLTVQPFDKGLTAAIEKAIRDADLGLNPAAQGQLIRVPVPALSEERRRELVKMTHKLAEEGKVAVRHARHDGLARIKKLDKLAEDERARGEKEIQKLTDDHTAAIDKLLQVKEAELMEV
jgi:ribosome recycling factor